MTEKLVLAVLGFASFRWLKNRCRIFLFLQKKNKKGDSISTKVNLKITRFTVISRKYFGMVEWLISADYSWYANRSGMEIICCLRTGVEMLISWNRRVLITLIVAVAAGLFARPRLICTDMLALDRSTPELCNAWVSVFSNLLEKITGSKNNQISNNCS